MAKAIAGRIPKLPLRQNGDPPKHKPAVHQTKIPQPGNKSKTNNTGNKNKADKKRGAAGSQQKGSHNAVFFQNKYEALENEEDEGEKDMDFVPETPPPRSNLSLHDYMNAKVNKPP